MQKSFLFVLHVCALQIFMQSHIYKVTYIPSWPRINPDLLLAPDWQNCYIILLLGKVIDFAVCCLSKQIHQASHFETSHKPLCAPILTYHQ